MKKTLLLSIILLVSLTVNADIYRWDNGELLTTKDAEPYADLSYEVLDFAFLQSASLSYADLSYAELSYADFLGAYLDYADLSYAQLQSANFFDADLTNANLSHANLSYADLQGAVLNGTVYTTETIFPSGFDPVAEGMILVPEPTTLLLFSVGGLLMRKRESR